MRLPRCRRSATPWPPRGRPSRSDRVGQSVTDPHHRPLAHQKQLEWTTRRLVDSAILVGPSTGALVRAILEARPHPNMAVAPVWGCNASASALPPNSSKPPAPAPWPLGPAPTQCQIHSRFRLDHCTLPRTRCPAPPYRRALAAHAPVRGAAYFARRNAYMLTSGRWCCGRCAYQGWPTPTPRNAAARYQRPLLRRSFWLLVTASGRRARIVGWPACSPPRTSSCPRVQRTLISRPRVASTGRCSASWLAPAGCATSQRAHLWSHRVGQSIGVCLGPSRLPARLECPLLSPLTPAHRLYPRPGRRFLSTPAAPTGAVRPAGPRRLGIGTAHSGAKSRSARDSRRSLPDPCDLGGQPGPARPLACPLGRSHGR